MSEAAASKPTFADRLNHLFATTHQPGRGPYSNGEVAEAIRHQGTPISHSYIWMLRKGQTDNPSKKHMEALAGFFGVPVAYFFDDEVAKRIDAELELISAMRDTDVREVALRASELTPEGLRAIADVIRHIHQTETGRSEPVDPAKGTGPSKHERAAPPRRGSEG